MPSEGQFVVSPDRQRRFAALESGLLNELQRRKPARDGMAKPLSRNDWLENAEQVSITPDYSRFGTLSAPAPPLRLSRCPPLSDP